MRLVVFRSASLVAFALVALVALGACAPSPDAAPAAATPPPPPPEPREVSFGGWKMEVVESRTQKEPTYINDPVFTLGDAPAQPSSKKVTPKGLLWMITVKATKSDSTAPDIPATKTSVVDDSGNVAHGLAGGAQRGESTFYMKGMFIDRSATIILLFDLPDDARPRRLKFTDDGPGILLAPTLVR